MEQERRQLRVLAVDDNQAIRLLLADVLSEAGYRVLIADNGAEAVEILEVEPVDVLITDYDMPRMNGLELIQWSRAHMPHATTVLVTGHDPEAIRAKDWPLGAPRILRKPFSEEDLLLLLGELRDATLTA
jgi:two-component system chemotaxis response regulator CheY